MGYPQILLQTLNYLRSKLDPPGQPSLIRTVRGIGFALVPPEGK